MPFPGNPNTYDFGTAFNYAVWPIDTTIELLNVPWNNDYRDTVRFADRTALDSYITSRAALGIKIERMSYVKPNQPVRIDLPMNAVLGFNYLRATNPVQPVTGDVAKTFYYFITDVRYVAPMTTELVLQLDVWQTYVYDIELGNSYVERGHIGIANTKAFDNFGRDYLTVPEGLDIGGEYQVVTKKTKAIMSPHVIDDPTPSGQGWNNGNSMIIAVSTINLTADPGTVNAPKLSSARGGGIQNMPSGASLYIWPNYQRFVQWMQSMSGLPWITQGIVSLYSVPDIRRYGAAVPDWPTDSSDPSYYAPRFFSTGYDIKPIRYSGFPNWRSASALTNYIPERYRHLKKLLTYPYCALELTTWTGQPFIAKPEIWNDANATIMEEITVAQPGARIGFHPWRYNARSGQPDEAPNGQINGVKGGDDFGDYLDVGTQIANLPSFSIVNNGAIAYLANNANQIPFMHQSADWSQQRALAGAQSGYDNASVGIDATKLGALIDQSNMYSNNSNANNAMVGNALVGLGGSALGAAGSGSPAGVAMAGGSGVLGLIGQSINQGQMNTAVDIAATTSQQHANNSMWAQGEVRDTNKDLADWAARGDYANTIAGINAKTRDAALTPPSIAGQMGGEKMLLANGHSQLSIRVKMIDQAAIRVVGEYWLRYGYTIHKFMKIPASFMVMSKFTYWKLTETYISTGPMPELFKQSIRGIFEKGVTVWANPADIGNIDIADNAPLGGISY